jgi:hypothetical protein
MSLPAALIQSPPILKPVRNRGAEAVEVIGHPDPNDAGLPLAIRRETERGWTRWIEPLISEHWPEVRDTPFYPKFKIGAQQVYAPAPYTVVLTCAARPWPVRVALAACRALRIPPAGLTNLVRVFLPLICRVFLRVENRRIALMGAFIALADEAFDHHLEDVPLEERPQVLRAVLERRDEGPNPPFRLLRAIVDHCFAGCSTDEAEELRRALEGCARWGESEVRRLQGEEDPAGLAHRMTGIVTGIDGIAWTVRRWITRAEWDWMYGVSEFIQILDDYVDAEKDLREGTHTPIHDGTWTLQTVSDHFDQTTRVIGDVVASNGETHPPYVRLAQDAYRHQVQDLLQNMVSGVAD